jgi:shikimate dehydrogenase
VAVLRHLDEVNPVDRGIGSVNTVVNEAGKLHGFGTDGPGALKALADAGVRVNGKTVTILGSGGAARAIAFTLATKAKPKQLAILGVIEIELKALVRDLTRKTGVKVSGALIEPRSLAKHLSESQVLIHCTPIGMHPNVNDSVVPKELLHDGLAVMDIVYNPLRTRLLADAEAAGLVTVSGLDMFVNQAVLQFELWTGKKAPREVMHAVVSQHLEGKPKKK